MKPDRSQFPSAHGSSDPRRFRRRATVLILSAAPALLGAQFALPAANAAPHAQPRSVAYLSTMSGALTPGLATRLSRHANDRVIIVMRAQPPAAPIGSAAAAHASAAVSSWQAPLLAELRAVHAGDVRSFTLVNSIAATVSRAEVARLRSDPDVARVIPNSTIQGPRLGQVTTSGSSRGATSSKVKPHVIPGACGRHGKVQLDSEGLGLTHTDSLNPHAKTARSLGYTGAGVKVAWIADGIDPHNINFIRKNGKSVFTDFKDFSGDGPGQPTDADEAFLDANQIAGQGRHVYDVRNFSAQPDPTACKIRIEGAAPGVKLVGLNVFGTNEDTTQSNFLQAIDYAVEHDHVNVLNESFGSNPFPDVSSLDITKRFDDAAVADGVVVVVSSGDAGSNNTIGSPATDPRMIDVGASTDLRFYAQTNYALARDFATTGWLNDNISSLSSGGYSETGETVDLVAPGELSFASCDASSRFFGCINFKGEPSKFEESGGTSESAPFVSGIAALVIQAYRQAHHGATPTPALVKRILDSTATDLGTPATEQGAGLVNSYRATELASSIRTSDGSASKVGHTLMLSANQLNAVGEPGSQRSWKLTIRNEGSTRQKVHIYGRTFGPNRHIQSGSVKLEDSSSPKVANYQGIPNNYHLFHFKVAKNQDRLVASLAYPGKPANGNNSRVRMILVDPSGRFAAHSFPQGVGNYGSADVRRPEPGRWTGVLFGDVASQGGTNGRIPWRVATERFVRFGSVGRSHISLAPGAHKTVTVRASTPSSPGDASGAFVVDPSLGSATSVPVTLRSMIDVSKSGRFKGVLTGGNGRPNGEGQQQYYEFRVGHHVSSISADLSLKNDAGDPVGEYLVAPDGETLGYGQNSLGNAHFKSASAYTVNPKPGVWTLVVDFAEPVVGNELRDAYTGRIRFDATKASAPGLPDSAHTSLPAGTPVTVHVRVKNTGPAPEEVFLDARSRTVGTLDLAPLDQATGLSLPLTGYPPLWLVSTDASKVRLAATSNRRIMFDYEPNAGDPDLISHGSGSAMCATTETASHAPSGGVVTPGVWYAFPSECGPYSAPAKSGKVSMTMTAKARKFDHEVTSSTGDVWFESVNPSSHASPVKIKPGQTVVIKVTVTPSGSSGTVVKGDVFVDTLTNSVPPYGQLAGDELVALPYKYTIS